MKYTLSSIFALLVFCLVTSCTSDSSTDVDPLPSWNEGPSKKSIIDFVTNVTDAGGPHYVKPGDRVATFDNDGTLWAEQPLYFQLIFAMDRIREMAPDHPEWSADSLMSAVINSDTEAILAAGEKGLFEILMTSHTGMTTQEFEDIVLDWTENARHVTKGKRYIELVYQPMLEVLDYLRANEFEVYIVSGGGIEFMRPWTEAVYGIPKQNVVGSSIKVKFEMTDSGPELIRLPEINFIDDKEGKPVGINQHIGKRPIASFGNSDGDLQMLQWAEAGDGPSLMVFIHHTDADREWAYDRDSHIGNFDKGLDEATEKGWTIVDMKSEWATIFPN